MESQSSSDNSSSWSDELSLESATYESMRLDFERLAREWLNANGVRVYTDWLNSSGPAFLSSLSKEPSVSRSNKPPFNRSNAKSNLNESKC
jgi:hypothetical protein